MLTGELIRMERQLDQDIEKNDHYEIRYALLNLEMRLMPRMARLSREIDASLLNADQRAGERKFQKTLQEDIARMMYKAGVHLHANACPVTKGPCSPNFWLVMINGTISCEAIPANCVADGQHIYWSPNPETVPAECHHIGKRGPCSIDQVVSRDATGAVSCVVSKEPVKAVAAKIAKTAARNNTATRNARLNSGAITTIAPEPEAEAAPQKKKDTKKPVTPVELNPSSMWDQQSCSLGSYRKQTGKCPPY